MERFRLSVGHNHGATPREIFGAVANEGDIEGRHIGRIQIFEDHSLIDLPQGMPDETLKVLQRARVCGQPLAMSRDLGHAAEVPERADGRGPRRPKQAGDRPARDRARAGAADAGHVHKGRGRFSEDAAGAPGRVRASRRDAFTEPTRPPRPGAPRPGKGAAKTATNDTAFADRPPRKKFADAGAPKTAKAGKAAKKRGGPKKRVDKDKGKRRTPRQ